MARKRLPMRKVKEILRLKLDQRLSHRQVARALGVSAGEVGKISKMAEKVGLEWANVACLDEAELDKRLYGREHGAASTRQLPDYSAVHAEYQKKGLTLALLHVEYLESNPGGLQYTQFCEHYRRWLKARKLSMHQVHRAGEKLFTDFSGKKPTIVDPITGEVTEVELFVAVMGASSYTFSRACQTQKVADWIDCHVLAFEFIGGLPEMVIPDQLRSAVSVPCRYEPVIQRNYEEMAAHYNVAVLPARPKKPKDKALVEVGVQIVQRWICARMRREIHHTLASLNDRVSELLVDLNHRVMRKYGASRRERFEQIDLPALRALPVERYQHAEWKKAKVNIDYHIELHRHFYSVPYRWRGEVSEVRFTTRTIEVYINGTRVTSHVRSYVEGGYTTVAEHMPKAHQAHLKWSPSRLIDWAEKEAGPTTAELVQAILESKLHPEQGYRTCLGIMRLCKIYGRVRLEAASARALTVGAYALGYLDSILKKGLDREPLAGRGQQKLPLIHENIRGKDYYQ